MIGIQRHTRHLHAIDQLALQQLDTVARVHLAARVIGETGDNLHLEPLAHQLTRKHYALKCRFRVKPLR